MSKVYLESNKYYNDVKENLKEAFSQIEDIINFNRDIQIERDFEELGNLENYISDCYDVKNRIRSIINFTDFSKREIEKIESNFYEKARILPSRKIAKRKKMDL